MNCGRVPTVDTYDGVVLIFHPDFSGKADSARVRRPGNFENETSDLTLELPSDVVETVMELVESSSIDKGHLQETIWFEGPQQSTLLGTFKHRPNLETSLKMSLAEKVVIRFRHRAERLVGLSLLDIGLDQWVVIFQRGHHRVFLFEDAIDDLFRLETGRRGLCVSLVILRFLACQTNRKQPSFVPGLQPNLATSCTTLLQMLQA